MATFRVGIAHIAVGAVGGKSELAVGALDGRPQRAGTVEIDTGVAGGNPGDSRTVSAERVGSGIGRANRRDDIAALGGELVRRYAVGVGNCRRDVVVDVDLQGGGGRGLAVEVGGDDGEVVVGAWAR